MKIGMCRNFRKVNTAFEMGADYAEIGAWDLYNLNDEEFDEYAENVKQNNYNLYSCNGLVPGDVRLTGDVDWNIVKEYADKTFYRLGKLGIHMAVFGSSRAKYVPEGFSFEKAWEQLFEVGRIFSDYAKKNNTIVTVEALRRAEVNIVNTIEDSAYYVKNVNRDNFLIMADFYHMNENGEDLSVIEKYKDKIVHIHMANSERYMPTEKDEQFLTERINLLKKIGYKGNISLECGFGTDEETAKVIAHMKELAE